ncbi:PREDICTED: uncharacterized protein LOC109580699 [Amphimedon queenslandica]|uniref:Uncharacterized protein n=1 Tax=Amphimedon queenslandica TaxID=400682 RepID=A0A1X7VAW0_AMPQE|nr:PREDICTED: uncharacterized protein LOC109580699 [Amphimedon queenslandica]|eukprot:XP_019849721.1 PREDICTED: uncharacterized protein LOC109580699 [Amphimedon queenslandica]
MNWVGGARTRVRHQNERKLQKEFFERKRHAVIGRGGTAKRTRQSSPPMDIQYKRIVSQDLISLRALRQTCDDHNIENKVKDNGARVPQKITLPSSNQQSNFNLDLSTSPGSQPSMLDLGSISFYDNQPKVSTAKFPPPAMDFKNRPTAKNGQKSLHNWSLNTTLNAEETSESFLDESVFHSHQRKLHPLSPPIPKQELTSQNHSILTESVLPIGHNRVTKPPPPPPNDDSFLSESIFHSHVKPSKPFHVHTGSLLTDTESIFPDYHSSKKPILQHSLNNDHTLLANSTFHPYKAMPLQANSEIPIKKPARFQCDLDDRRDRKRKPLACLENKSSFQWEDINWYNKQKPVLHQQGQGTRHDQTVYKKKRKSPIYDRETPFSTVQQKSLASLVGLPAKTANDTILKKNRHTLPLCCSPVLSDEDPVGISSMLAPEKQSVIVTHSPTQQLLCTEILSQTSTESSTEATMKKQAPLSPSLPARTTSNAFESMMVPFEKPLSADTSLNGGEFANYGRTPQSRHWMDFTGDFKPVKKTEYSTCDEVVEPVLTEDLNEIKDSSKSPSSSYNEREEKMNCSNFDTCISEIKALDYSEVQTQTEACNLKSSETQVDSSILRTAQTQTETSVSKYSETQTDPVADTCLETGTKPVIQETSATQTEPDSLFKESTDDKLMPIARDILRDLKLLYDSISSSSTSSNKDLSLSSLLTKLECLDDLIKKRKDDIVWCKLMLELNNK